MNDQLRRSAQAKAKRGLSPASKQTTAVKPSKKAKSIKADEPTTASNQMLSSRKQALKIHTYLSGPSGDYKAKCITKPFEESIKALIQSKSSSMGSKPWPFTYS